MFGNGHEPALFFYHPDHLGSTGMVTDNNATVTQGFLYTPFGELLYEYSPGWQTGIIPKYSFNAKELDEENGMYYYSARYYAPPTFISRDEKFEEFPTISPYSYCKGNPVILVDPDGRDFFISGEKAQLFIDQLNNYTTMQLYIEDGKVKYSNEGDGSLLDRILLEVIDKGTINVNISCGDGYAGACMGAEYIEDQEGKKKSATGIQEVDPEKLGEMDKKVGDKKIGGYAVHELAEAYFSAKISLKKRKSSPPAERIDGKYPKGCTYLKAHKKANKVMKGGYYYDNGYRIDYDNPVEEVLPNGNKKTTYKSIKVSEPKYIMVPFFRTTKLKI